MREVALEKIRAADIIHKLWEAGETTQLELLMTQAKRSLEVPFESKEQDE